MKPNRLLSLLLLMALVLALAACGGGETTAPEPTAATAGQLPAATVPVVVDATLPPPVVAGEVLPTPTLAAEGGEAAPVEPAAAEPAAPWPANQFGYGIQVHGNATVGDPASTMQAVRDQLGLSWVKMQIQWWLVEPDQATDQWFFYDAVIDQAHDYGLRLN